MLFSSTLQQHCSQINLEQYCEIEGYSLRVYYDPVIPDYQWKVDLCGDREWINSGFGSTQLKALANLVDEINKTKVFPLTITLGRKGWIKRTTYK